jgi:hypothetical protein
VMRLPGPGEGAATAIRRARVTGRPVGRFDRYAAVRAVPEIAAQPRHLT